MISDKDFQKAAALLKHAAPADEWENFIGAFKAYTYMQIGHVADAGIADVVLAQGYARQCKKLLRLLEECELKPKGDKP